MPRLLALLLLLATVAHAFVMQQPVRSLPVAVARSRPVTSVAGAATAVLAEEPPPIVPPRSIKIKGNTLTPYGVL